jgi:predicted  nucleic acid-binding Zn-ribbon protein
VSDPIQVLRELNDAANELDSRSQELWRVQLELTKVQTEYDEEIGAFVERLWKEFEKTGKRIPSEDIRTRLAHREMDPELLGRYIGLQAQRKRLEARIDHLRTVVGGKRSVLSAQKVELEAARAPF